MLRMWKHCNTADFRSGLAAQLALFGDTMDLLDGYVADGVEFEMHDEGLLLAFRSGEKMRNHQRNLDVQASFGLVPEILVGDAVREREPLLSDEVVGGLFFPRERHLDPASLASGLYKRCIELGVTINENAAVVSVDRRGDRIVAVHSGGNSVAADRFLLAAGAWTGVLAPKFGMRLPIRPGKGYCIELAPIALRSAVNFCDAKVAATPLDDRFRLAGTMEFGGLDEEINPRRVSAIAKAPSGYLRDWSVPALSSLEPRAGMRPMTPDGLPVMGRIAGLSNAFVSSGHGMMGVTLAPSSAAAMTDLLLDGHTAPVLLPFDPNRFSRRSAKNSNKPRVPTR
jgi:D-amino-acid dehydrogenase